MAEAVTSAERNALPTVHIDEQWFAGERLLSTTLLKRTPDELAVTIGEGRGRTPRTDAFAKLLLNVASERDGIVPLSFKLSGGGAAMLDWGCVGYLAKHTPPEIDLDLDRNGFVVSVRPTEALLRRYGERAPLEKGQTFWAALALSMETPEAGWAGSTQSWIRPKSRGGMYVSCAYNSQAGWLRVGLTAAGDDAADAYNSLLAQRGRIEREIGEPLTWDAQAGRSERQVYIKLPCNPTDTDDWQRQHGWMAERLPKFETLLTSAT